MLEELKQKVYEANMQLPKYGLVTSVSYTHLDQAEILVESEKGVGTCFKIFLNKKI